MLQKFRIFLRMATALAVKQFFLRLIQYLTDLYLPDNNLTKVNSWASMPFSSC